MRRFSAGDFARIEGRMGDLDRPVLSLLLVLLTATGAAAEESRNCRLPIRPAERCRERMERPRHRHCVGGAVGRSSPFCISLRGAGGCAACQIWGNGSQAPREARARGAATQGDRQVVVCWDCSNIRDRSQRRFALIDDVPEATHVLDYASWLGDTAAAQSRNRWSVCVTVANPSRYPRSLGTGGTSKSVAGPCRAAPLCGSGMCRGAAAACGIAREGGRTEGAFGALCFGSSVGRLPRLETGRRRSYGLCNEIYAEAVEAPDDKAAIDNKIELLKHRSVERPWRRSRKRVGSGTRAR